jgi:hypothetical protein
MKQQVKQLVLIRHGYRHKIRTKLAAWSRRAAISLKLIMFIEMKKLWESQTLMLFRVYNYYGPTTV